MIAFQPGFDEFRDLAARFNRVPVVATLVCDDTTPVSAFARLERGSERAFLLESVVGGENVARYSFLGVDPATTFEATREQVRLVDQQSGATRTLTTADPLGALEFELRRVRAARLPGLPRFLGGAVGFAGYDAARYYERLPNAPPDDRGLPDLLFDFYETLVVFDHASQVARIVSHATIDDAARVRDAYDQAAARIEALASRLAAPSLLRPVRVDLPAHSVDRFESNFTRESFERAVERCKEYIRAGDVFQVVLSQRLAVGTVADPLDIYRALRVINPSPFMFFLKSPGVILVGSSPEIMCRVRDGMVTNRPLAGTRRRGATEAEDRQLREELLADPKERAEHVMLVDLGRNDVGRVAVPGSVKLSELMSVEYYSHVMHISSTVTGELAAGKTAFDALRATLPVGTVSGAPKVRAMEIIDELEPTRRGPYAGAVGYMDFSGNMDTCIALRTMVIQDVAHGQSRSSGSSASEATPAPVRGGIPGETAASMDSRTTSGSTGPDSQPRRRCVYIQAGAGIVADSVPAGEYQETLNKAQGMLAAIGLAETSFG
jgi:anthranilate synthase component 1